jgi:hypothetical protein
LKPCPISRAVWVGSLICAVSTWFAANSLGQDANWEKNWDTGVRDKWFKDDKTDPKKPTHRLGKVCDPCQDLANQLQNALDDWYALQYADGEAIRKDGLKKQDGDQQKAGNLCKDNAMAGLGQPNAKDLKAKQDKQKKDAKDDPAKFGDKKALAKEIERLTKLLDACLDDCAKATPTPTPTPGPKEVTPEGGGKAPSKPGEEELPALPAGDCWPSQEAKDKFYQELKDADEELEEDAKEATSHGKIQNAIEKIKKKKEEAKKLREAADKITKICPKPGGGGGKGVGPGKGKPKRAPRVATGGNVSYGGPTEDFCDQIEEKKVNVDTVGTGETIGHVADLYITNLTDQPIEVAIPPMILESRSGKNQHYAVPKGETVEVPPHQTVKVPLDGVCIARNKPPVGDGVHGDLAINDCDPDAKIGQDQADLISRIEESTYEAADELEDDGDLKDIPYRDPEKRKHIVVQWSTWMNPRISEITGAPPATKDDLKKVVYKQLPHTPTGDEKKKIDKSIDTIFAKIELTSEKAKDLEKPSAEEETETPPPGSEGMNVSDNTPTPAPQTEEKPKKKKKKEGGLGQGLAREVQDWIGARLMADSAHEKLLGAQEVYVVALSDWCYANSKHYKELKDACDQARVKAQAKGATQADKEAADKACKEAAKQSDALEKDFLETKDGKAAQDKLKDAKKAADDASKDEQEKGKKVDQKTKDALFPKDKK